MITKYDNFLNEELSNRELRDEVYLLGIRDYKINRDLSIDVEKNVDIRDKNLEKIPIKFRKVGWNFIGFFNELTSLEGSPSEVGSSFYCDNNKLTDLKGSPEKVGGDYRCNDNLLTSLEGCTKTIPHHFDCSHNQLTDLSGGPSYVGMNYYCRNNKLKIDGYPRDCTIIGNFGGPRYFNTILELTRKYPEKYDALRDDKTAFHQQVMRDAPDLIPFYKKTKIPVPSKRTII